MERWRDCWRRGIAPLLSTASLAVLVKALVEDDPRLIQGATCVPGVIEVTASWRPEQACALGYAGWIGDGLETVSEIEEFYVRLCDAIDERLADGLGFRWFVNWFDDTPRLEMRSQLLPEVERSLSERLLAA